MTKRDMAFSSLKRSLTVLGIDVSDIREKCPNYTVVKKAFRKLLMLHPDKGGNTLEFQRITEAFRDVMDYMRNNPDNIEDQEGSEIKEEEEDTKLRKVFENAHNVKYNENVTAASGGNITFKMKEEEAKQWLKSLDAYFVKIVKKQLPHGGCQYIDKSWQIPGKSDSAASLSVTVWTDSKEPSMLIQGKHHIPFVALVLPKIAMTLGKMEDEISAIMDEQNEIEIVEVNCLHKDTPKKKEMKKDDIPDKTETHKEKGESQQEKTMEKAIENEGESANIKDPKTDKKNKTKDLPPKQTEPFKEKKKPEEGISKEKGQRIELEEVGFTMNRLEKGMETRFQDMISTLSSTLAMQSKTEAKVAELTDQLKVMNTKVEAVLEKVEKVDLTTTQTAKTVTENKELLQLEEGWKQQKDKVKHILDTVLKLEKKMENMHKIVAKYNPKESIEESLDKAEEVESDKVEDEEKKREGIMFTSSVAKSLNLKTLEEATNSKVERVKTYRILDKPNAKDPEFHLSNMVKTHVRKEHKFTVLVVGSNDIDDAVESKEDVVEKMEKQAERLVTVAAALVTDLNMEVFISEMIPRKDDTDDGEVSKAELSTMANSFMKAKVAMVPHSTSQHLHVVRHSNLARPEGVERDKLFKDEKHLTNLGLKQFNNNLISAMSKVFKDIKVKEDIITKPNVAKQAGPKVPPKPEMPKPEQQKHKHPSSQSWEQKFQSWKGGQGGKYQGSRPYDGQHQGDHQQGGQYQGRQYQGSQYQGSQHQGSQHHGGHQQGGQNQGGQYQGSHQQGGQYQGSYQQGSQNQGSQNQGSQNQGSHQQGGQYQSGQHQGGQYQGGHRPQQNQTPPTAAGYWGPPSSPPPSPCPPPTPPPPPPTQYHWVPTHQGHYSQGGQGGHHQNYTGGKY